MKKTLLITLDYLPDTGGIAQYWAGLNNYLSKDNFFILAPFSINIKDEKNVIRKKFLSKYFWPHWLVLLWQIYLLQKKENYKHFIAGQILPVGTVLYIFKKIGFIKTYFVSLHGLDIYSLAGRKKFLAKYILRSAEKIIVNSDFTKQAVLQINISTDKIIKVYPCPQIEVGKLLYGKEFVKKNKKILLTVCRLVERKGVDIVIKSLPYVWQDYPDVKYIIVGSGPEKQRLQTIVQKEIDISYQKNIFFAGQVEIGELNKFYQSADIFILLPREIAGDVEGFGMVYLEAGLYGLPVIATATGGVCEAVKDGITGIILPVEPDLITVANTIKLLFNDNQLRNKYGLANSDFAHSFKWQSQAEKLKEHL